MRYYLRSIGIKNTKLSTTHDVAIPCISSDLALVSDLRWPSSRVFGRTAAWKNRINLSDHYVCPSFVYIYSNNASILLHFNLSLA